MALTVEQAYQQLRRLLATPRCWSPAQKRRNRLGKQPKRGHQSKRNLGGQELTPPDQSHAPSKATSPTTSYPEGLNPSYTRSYVVQSVPFIMKNRTAKRPALNFTQQHVQESPSSVLKRQRSQLQQRHLLENLRQLVHVHWMRFVQRSFQRHSSVAGFAAAASSNAQQLRDKMRNLVDLFLVLSYETNASLARAHRPLVESQPLIDFQWIGEHLNELLVNYMLSNEDIDMFVAPTPTPMRPTLTYAPRTEPLHRQDAKTRLK